MKNNKYIISALSAVLLTTSVFADDHATTATKELAAQHWVISLGGVGATDTKNSTTPFGVDLSIGRTGEFLLPNELGIRQGIAHADSSTTFNTRLYNDWTLITVAKLEVFAGGAIGFQYGDNSDEWEIAPEAGFRWWLKPDVALLARAELPWNLENWVFQDTVRYFVGFSVRF